MNLESLSQFMHTYGVVIKSLLIAGIGFLCLWMFSSFLTRKTKKILQPHIQVLFNKLVWYGGLLLLAFVVLSELGINVTALIGAAGVLGVAVGFASQTSVSNIISGIFLVIEHPFKVGDLIEVGTLIGKVETIDLLAVRLKTSDGQLVRVPNESLIKSSVINKTFYKARRVTIALAVKRGQEVMPVVQLTRDELGRLEVVKKDPELSISFASVGSMTTGLCLQCWVDSRAVVSSTAVIIQALSQAYARENLAVSIDANQVQQSLLELLEGRLK